MLQCHYILAGVDVTRIQVQIQMLFCILQSPDCIPICVGLWILKVQAVWIWIWLRFNSCNNRPLVNTWRSAKMRMYCLPYRLEYWFYAPLYKFQGTSLPVTGGPQVRFCQYCGKIGLLMLKRSNCARAQHKAGSVKFTSKVRVVTVILFIFVTSHPAIFGGRVMFSFADLKGWAVCVGRMKPALIRRV